MKDFDIKRTKKKGVGLFAKRPYKKGELVYRAIGPFVFRNPDKRAIPSRWLGLGKYKWVATKPKSALWYTNHSCLPNMGISGERDFVALRNIKSGEELSFDYSITSDDDKWLFDCDCGSLKCRKLISSVRFLNKRTYKKYLPHIPPVIQNAYEKYHQR